MSRRTRRRRRRSSSSSSRRRKSRTRSCSKGREAVVKDEEQ